MDELPTAGRIAHSERIFRGPYGLQAIYTFGEGDVLQLDGRVFGVAADYQAPNGVTFTQLVISYPGESIAAAAFANCKAHLDSYLAIVQESVADFTFKDFRQKHGKISLSNNKINIAIGLDSIPK